MLTVLAQIPATISVKLISGAASHVRSLTYGLQHPRTSSIFKVFIGHNLYERESLSAADHSKLTGYDMPLTISGFFGSLCSGTGWEEDCSFNFSGLDRGEWGGGFGASVSGQASSAWFCSAMMLILNLEDAGFVKINLVGICSLEQVLIIHCSAGKKSSVTYFN